MVSLDKKSTLQLITYDWFDQIASLMGTVETLYSRKSTKYEFFQQLLKPPTIKELISYKKSAEIQLENIILELKTVGLPNSTSHSSIFHNEVTQNVAQTVNIEVVSVLENQIPPVTINESIKKEPEGSVFNSSICLKWWRLGDSNS